MCRRHPTPCIASSVGRRPLTAQEAIVIHAYLPLARTHPSQRSLIQSANGPLRSPGHSRISLYRAVAPLRRSLPSTVWPLTLGGAPLGMTCTSPSEFCRIETDSLLAITVTDSYSLAQLQATEAVVRALMSALWDQHSRRPCRNCISTRPQDGSGAPASPQGSSSGRITAE
jgi:hypothetical protein